MNDRCLFKAKGQIAKKGVSVLSKERLTYRNRIEGEAYLRYGVAAKWEKMPRYDILNNGIQKLAEYEDLEEQGLFLRLPCKVGDTLYQICDGFIEPCTVETIYIGNYVDSDGEYGNMAEIHYNREDCPWVSTEMYFTDIGKTVFLTQSEAEEKLRELEEK